MVAFVAGAPNRMGGIKDSSDDGSGDRASAGLDRKTKAIDDAPAEKTARRDTIDCNACDERHTAHTRPKKASAGDLCFIFVA